MAPILIDGRDIIKLGFISVLVAILVFVSGFFIGHQQALSFYQAGREVQSLSLPEQVVVLQSVIDSQVPSAIEAGENIDVDQPESTKQASNVVKDLKPYSALIPTAVAAVSSENKKPASRTQNTSNDHRRATSESGAGGNVSADDALIIGAFTSDDLSKIKYSIQVGVYGRLLNAENMVKSLQAQQYDAYVTDYTNKKNEMRYNVRLGYFADKKSAIATLNKFKTKQNGDGYLVKFSADNIVNVAGATGNEQTVEVPAGENKAGKATTPVVVPSGIVEDKISQVDITQADNISNPLVTTN